MFNFHSYYKLVFIEGVWVKHWSMEFVTSVVVCVSVTSPRIIASHTTGRSPAGVMFLKFTISMTSVPAE